MKRIQALITLLFVILAIYWSFNAAMPSYTPDASIATSSFSTDRAMEHVKNMAQKPHAVGFPAHAEVRKYIVDELHKMGLETSLQEGYTAGDWANLSSATNILARIEGSEEGKALVLLSHYDSNPHSSLGASDAGSGVATILEGIRAFLSEKKTPKNDIIILITDAEELGLNGADLFVNQHPWAKEVGLVLNFEARGSGGPGYMLIETNRGNGKLIEEFTKAAPEYPVANSLAYSIYKLLPNDTDLTVFREDGDIEGFNFAFIGDHFDYHTAQDTYDRLDKNTLAHQGSYLMPLLHYFADSDLDHLKSLDDYIYFNVPFFKLVSYPFEWIWPMFGLAVFLFIVLLIIGFRKKSVKLADLSKGFLPLLLSLGLNAIVGYYSWVVLRQLYPQYQDMLHGFTYNGYTYILAFALFSIGSSFWIYHRFKGITTANLLVAPLVLWLIICGALGAYLPGASFFIVPVFALLAAFMVTINQEKPNPYLLTFLCIPALLMLAPFVKMFPVGLGLKMMVAATAFSTLLFFLCLPLFGYYKHKSRLAYISMLLFVGFMLSAHFNAGFTKENAKPTSLLYVLDVDTNTAQWATYENSVSPWTEQYLKVDRTEEVENAKTISSKYGTRFTHRAPAPVKAIPIPHIEKTRDTIIGEERILNICITPQRSINRLELFTNAIPIGKAKVNSVPLPSYFMEQRNGGRLVTYYTGSDNYTELEIHTTKDSVLELTLYEASNDLLSNSLFSIPERPADNIPMPFVLNDAILLTKTVRFE
ncbi:M28 family peptidase [Spongiimicrobium salis]|uniref:M28 family peptidase n=1 Tax=Spongiimicrobium salis TaxID=1667022 RepID=UPI00374CC2FE